MLVGGSESCLTGERARFERLVVGVGQDLKGRAGMKGRDFKRRGVRVVSQVKGRDLKRKGDVKGQDLKGW